MKRACTNAGFAYRPPHAIRHTLAVSGEEVCRTLLDEKAWSQNLGHSSMTTTELSYGTLTNEAVGGRIERLSKRAPVDDLIALLETADPGHIELVSLLLSQLREQR